MNLEETRKQIDELDQVLVETFEKRLAAVLNIAKIKEAKNLKIYDPERENKVLEKGLAYVNDPSLRDYVKHFLNDVMAVSRSYQKDHIQQHIFLVGMPGAGKTTVGKALAQRQDMDFYDVDALIQEKTGKSIQNVIIYEGEEAFRELEYEVISDIVTNKKPSVVATGGGTVLSEKTVKLMRDSGFVVFIHRDVTRILYDLDMEIRPLLKESIEYIFRLYEERYPLYEKVCHVKIQNASSIGDAVNEIIDALPNVER